jgi:hypothetical protein
VRRPRRLDPRVGADWGLRGCAHGGSVAGWGALRSRQRGQQGRH